MELVPIEFWLITIFVFGTIIGSFLNVYLYRFHTGRTLTGDSHCLSCGTSLKWFELVPLVSYLGLWGRCRTCSAYVPPRYFVVELSTALLFVLTFWHVGFSPLLALFLFVSVLLVLITVYDLYHLIIPNEFVLALALTAAAYLGYQWYQGVALEQLGFDVLAAISGAAFFGALWYVSNGRWIGFGDVKLAVPLGLLVGYQGVFSLIVLSFWIGAIISLAYLGLQWVQNRGQVRLPFLPRQLTIKSEVPFAPFLILSFIAVFFFEVGVVSILFYAF